MPAEINGVDFETFFQLIFQQIKTGGQSPGRREGERYPALIKTNW